MIRQIFVFTNSLNLDTLQLLGRSAPSPLHYIRPFSHDAPKEIKALRQGDFLMSRTSGVNYDDSDLESARKLKEDLNIELSHPLSALKILRDKSLQAKWLKEHNLPHPPTIVPTLEDTNELKGDHLILKTKRGNQGHGVFKLTREEFSKHWQELVAKGDTEYILQESIEDQRELRLLVLGPKVHLIEKKGAHWKKNAQHCEFQPFKGSGQDELIALAHRIANKLKCKCFAVDLFIAKDNSPTIIEINANPGLMAASKALPEEDLGRDFFAAFGFRKSCNH